MFNYFFELRNRVFYLSITYLLLILLSFYYKEALLYFLVKTSLFQNDNSFPYFIYTNLTEVFNTYIKISFLVSSYIVLPFSLFHFISYISPALYLFESKILKLYLLGAFLFWVITNLTIYNLFIPLLWEFFLCFEMVSSQGPVGLQFEARLKEYIEFLFVLYFFINIAVQFLYLVLTFTLKYSESNLNFINKSRRYIYVFIFLFASFITPPDVLSQLLIAIPLIIIYEIIILFFLVKKEYDILKIIG
jgi:sec-independent protein translocase protein TatC